MKKSIFILGAAFLIAAFTTTQLSAQSSYKTGLGLGLDFGDGATFVGPSVKHFFNANNAGQAEVLFANRSTNLNLFYQYHEDFKGASGLKWYVGGGPGIYFYDNDSDFSLKPMVGLDYKIGGAPISFAFDWRPTIYFAENDTDFLPGRFGLGFRVTF